MPMPIQQFSTQELQVVQNIGSSSVPGAWATQNGVKGLDCLIENVGGETAYVVFSTTASPTALNIAGNVSGTQTNAIPAGAIMVFGKGATGYFACITDNGTTTLNLHSGRGN